ncbi:family 16 glycoside hydrolase [Flagellimonas sediminis]|uniref:DUF1080 domain-containing protein n=1 Tax=Flagellimonas sediminis TaxID=2696468 RepID=A0A6I5KRS6_9FLAO|nr:family 16 glycoside hydrolase [Allomuricauda sediminis]NDV43257.1 DUF1080 domain-containing protein [Allomuricauda sediminis]
MKQFSFSPTWAIMLLLSFTMMGQSNKKLTNPDSWEVQNRDVSFDMGVIHLDDRPGDGVLWLKGSDFHNGTIELDIKGKDKTGASFVGLAFNGKNDSIFDAVYFRPFNFNDPEKQDHMMQYIAMPHLDWKKLREEYPGKYENTISPAPQPNDWFHVTLNINYPEVKVYVNHSMTPSLVVEQINLSGHGKIGLWVGESSEGWFKNISIKENKMNSLTHILMDVGHNPVFWNDPKSMSMENEKIGRVYMMSEELMKTANNVHAQVDYAYGELSDDLLANTDILFIHIPKKKYTENEVRAIHRFIDGGGGLFLVMDSDYWSSLNDTNVNDIIAPYGIQYGDAIPDKLPGGHTVKSEITDKPLKISYHEARKVLGGTPFCYGDELDKAYPFATYTKTMKGGKLVVLGEAMASLYMTSWQGVDDYQCQDFMQDVFNWLK